MILAFIISFVIPVKRVRPIRGSALVHIMFTNKNVLLLKVLDLILININYAVEVSAFLF